MKWANPPNPDIRRFGVIWKEESEQLKAHPGEWAIIKSFSMDTVRARGKASSLASEVRTGKHLSFRPQGAFEAVSRAEVEDGKEVINVYARYTGEQPDDN